MKNMKTNMSPTKIANILAMTLMVLLLTSADAHASGLSGFFNSMMSSISSAISSALSTAASAISGFLGGIGSVLTSVGLGPLWNALLTWAFGAGACGQTMTAGGTGVGQMICNVVISTQMLPGLISGLSYLIGIVCAVTALVKLKDHVINPNQTPLSESMKRFVAGGAFLALPIITGAVKNLVYGTGAGTLGTYATTGFEATTSGGYGLDTMLIALVADILQPAMNLFGAFGYLAGLVFVVIGISRIIKTAQEGPRGPTGIGTIMTFVTAGILFSLDAIMASFGTSIMGDSTVEVYPVLSQTTGDAAVDDHIAAVITAVTAFMFIVGWVSFIRGFFILRDVSEGNGQASLMAAMTHIFGGALAVNLGPVMNAVQSTFGLTGFGVAFT